MKIMNKLIHSTIHMARSKTLLFSLFISSFVICHGQTLKELADAKGIYIGNIMSNGLLDNNNIDGGKPNDILRSEFNTTVLENAMKMNAILPNKPNNPFNFGVEALRKDKIDKFIKYCKEDDPNNQLRTRGHTMIWHSQAPGWLNSQAPNWSKQQVYDFTYHYIKAIATYCGTDMDEWDVFNELLANSGSEASPFRGNTWFRKAGSSRKELDDYVKFCFETAREFAPYAKLYYNDFNIARYNGGTNSKNGRMRAFASRLVANGTPIDGVGFQSHFQISFMASGNNANMTSINNIKRSMEELDKLGLEAAITELDIRRCSGKYGTDAGRKAAFKELTKMALSQPNCNTLVIWGISNKDSWISLGHAPGCDDPLLYNDSFNRNSGYFGVREALQEITGGPILLDKITSVASPASVFQGQVVTLPITYKASQSRDIVVMFQLDSDPWTLVEQVIENVPAGNATINVDITIPEMTEALEDAYQFQVYIAPTGLGWEDRLDNLQKIDIDVKEVEVKGPYLGVATAIPGVLQMENYDKGGASISYSDTDLENKGSDESSFRVEDGVDIGTGNGSMILGWTAVGEWLEYTVNVSEAGKYNMNITYSSNNGGGELGMDIDGSELFSGISVPSTGGWNTYDEFVEMVTLPEGEHVLRINIEKNGFNLDKMEFVKAPVTGVFSDGLSQIQVFPNPSQTGLFQLSQVSSWEVFTLQGVLVTSGQSDVIKLTGESKRVYLLKVNNHISKLVIQ